MTPATLQQAWELTEDERRQLEDVRQKVAQARARAREEVLQQFLLAVHQEDSESALSRWLHHVGRLFNSDHR